MIQVIKSGTQYDIDTSDGNYIRITFCHKNEQGKFVHGVTNEDLLMLLSDRFRTLLEKDDCHENIQALAFINQAKRVVFERNSRKLKNRKRNEQAEQSGNGLPGPAAYRKPG